MGCTISTPVDEDFIYNYHRDVKYPETHSLDEDDSHFLTKIFKPSALAFDLGQCKATRFVLNEPNEHEFLRPHIRDVPEKNLINLDETDNGRMLLDSKNIVMPRRTISSSSSSMSTGLELQDERVVTRYHSVHKQLHNKFYLKDFYEYPEEIDVLHLTMRSKMSHFYETTYLKTISAPHEPRHEEPSVSMTNTTPSNFLQKPGLMEVNSDESSKSSVTASNTNGFLSEWKERQLKCNGPLFKLADKFNFVVQGSLGFLTGFKAQIQLEEKNKKKEFLVLSNQTTGEPFAICSLKSPYGKPIVRMYATKPRVEGQEVSNANLCGNAVYRWAEFSVEGEFPLPMRYSISLVKDKSGAFEKEPSYRGSHTGDGVVIRVVGQTERELRMSGCCLISLNSTTDSDGVFSLKISEGVDPALFICLTAIVDELLESSMRRICYLNDADNSDLETDLLRG